MKTKLKISSAKFELSNQNTIAKVVQKGKVLAEIVICSDGLHIQQTKSSFISWNKSNTKVMHP